MTLLWLSRHTSLHDIVMCAGLTDRLQVLRYIWSPRICKCEQFVAVFTDKNCQPRLCVMPATEARRGPPRLTVAFNSFRPDLGGHAAPILCHRSGPARVSPHSKATVRVTVRSQISTSWRPSVRPPYFLQGTGEESCLALLIPLGDLRGSHPALGLSDSRLVSRNTQDSGRLNQRMGQKQ